MKFILLFEFSHLTSFLHCHWICQWQVSFYVFSLVKFLFTVQLHIDEFICFSAISSGTTVTFVIIDRWVITVASVGDSCCILESAEGTIYSLSADHRLEENEEE